MEESIKRVVNGLFSDYGIDESKTNEMVESLFNSIVSGEMAPEIKVNITGLKNIKRGNRGCVIYDGKYYYIMPFIGNVFGCTINLDNIMEDFDKFENNIE